MIDAPIRLPKSLEAIERETAAIGFAMASDRQTGALLRVLAASKPTSFFLELGTGTGLSTAWMLDGMSPCSTLLSVDNDKRVVDVARRHLRRDSRVTFYCEDGAEFLVGLKARTFDFIFADTWPGKYDHLEDALRLLNPGGLYVIDDMLPQPNWPEGHADRVAALLAELDARRDLTLVRMDWSTGIIVATKLPAT
jgi:predicted O-methyltransferase YrrM